MKPFFPYSRRRFLATGAAALGVAPMAYLRAQSGSPNEEISIGLIGCGGMGTGNIKTFLNIEGVRVVAVSDVDKKAMSKVKKIVDEFYGNKDCKIYQNYTDLLQHPELDTICLATPDHWHARIGIDAANAGLDIYGEKPFTWGLKEGRQLIDVLKKNETVWQTGSWQRSKSNFRRFKALIENGTLGKITRMECGTPEGSNIRKYPNLAKPPATFDWDMYCGPAGKLEYNSQVHPWNWRWLHTFGGGQLLDWVGHHVDIAMWTLGLDKTGPVKVEGLGERGDSKIFDAYDKYAYQGTFEDGRVLEVRSDFMGTKFTGENGWIHTSRGALKASDREMLRNLPDDYESKVPSHQQDFINCVRDRKVPQSDAEGAHRAASFGQLAIVAMESGQPVNWDPKAEKVIGNDEQANYPRLGSRIDVCKG
ncbi:Gfo/Idh/MocA family protein [Haloferula sp.]|uniref:Gfo/Idh/MocA family protein n=1 Tax=Haloferula sp. TaxID=2497595 RepID=UPI003C71B5DE